MRGFAGPKPAEVRIGLGMDRGMSSEVVPTGSQGGQSTMADKQNTGYSGTPMWKLALDRAQREQAAAASAPAVKIPDGFKPMESVSEVVLPLSKRPQSANSNAPTLLPPLNKQAQMKQQEPPPSSKWYYSEKRNIFWSTIDYKLYVLDPVTRMPAELHESISCEMKITVGACFHESSTQAKHILVKDLGKAAQSLRTSIEHLDRPAAIYALYEGHRGTGSSSGTGNMCADFCSKNLHQKIILKLAAFRGYWDDRRLERMMKETFEELDAEFASKFPSETDGCCAMVALVLGQRLLLASVGDVAGVVVTKTGEPVVPIKPHALRNPDDDDEDSEDDGGGGPVAEPGQFRWTRSFGDLEFKRAGSGLRLNATPDVAVISLNQSHRGIAIVARELFNAIGRGVAVSTVFKRSGGRPRMASGALVDAAVQWLGNVEGSMGLGSLVAFFEGTDEATSNPAKRRKIEQPSQVRLRHILLKHKECKSTTDKVRNKQVKRTRGEAERILRAVLEECEADPKKCSTMFTQRCRELSECTTSLTTGELAGDLGWVKPGKNEAKFGPSFDAAAFSLQTGQLSDLIDSEQGIHILIRAA
eukprot:TRINITY_DN14371_c0_g1_i2.p1 TRINITY_DN14371_c0_g1~~TRINITY_DN14371_c0_g1_i2.p1  ORF type:complete len:587 (-),score=128.74 TRINITY_DN14371_c0_g1_i2:34-1794(-)